MVMRYSLVSDSELTYPLPTFASLLATFLKIKAKKRFSKNFANTQVCYVSFFVHLQEMIDVVNVCAQ